MGLSTASMTLADTIKLKDGDQISGRLLAINSEKITIKTTHAGEIAIELGAVASMMTDTSITFSSVTEDKAQAQLQAKLELSAQSGYVMVDNKNIPLQDLRFDAPPNSTPTDTSIFAGLEGRVDASIENAQKNTLARYIELDGSLTWDMQPWRHKLDGKFRNYTEDKEKTEDSHKLEYSLDYFLTRDWFLRANSFYQDDRVAPGNNLRYSGAGIGRNVWKDKEGSLELMMIYDKLRIGSGVYQFQLNTWVFSADFTRKFDHEKWEVYAKADLLFPQHIPITVIMQSEAGLHYQLNASIYLSGKLLFDMTKYPGGAVNNHGLKMGIGVRW